MGAHFSNTKQSQAGQTTGAAPGLKTAFPVNITKEDLLKRLQDDVRDLHGELTNIKADFDKQKGLVSRPYIDMRLREIAEGLGTYSRARTDLFTDKSKEQDKRADSDAKGLDQARREDLQDKTHNEISRLRTLVKKLEDRNNDLTLRLSKLVGAKLVNNNPRIADLSDPNRPTKLGELYSELYDNEYTDAMEGLKANGLSDVEAVKTLRLTLLSTYNFCEKKSREMVTTVERAVTVMFDEYKLTVLAKSPIESMCNERYILEGWKKSSGPEKTPDGVTGDTRADLGATLVQGPISIEDKLKQFRKEVSYTLLPLVKKAYLKARWDPSCISALKPYIRKCLLITWCMAVQSPPLTFLSSEELPGEKFDTERYKVYTTSGDHVDYVVWPALCLHEDGPLLCKGIAQGRS